MQKNRWQLIDPFIVKSCSVPILTSEKCWSPGPEHVELGTNKEIIYSFKMFFTTTPVNFSRQGNAHQILINDVIDEKGSKNCKK